MLFIKAEYSDYIGSEAQPVIEQYLPQAQLKIMQGVGHWLHAEKPQLFNKLVERFLLN